MKRVHLTEHPCFEAGDRGDLAAFAERYRVIYGDDGYPRVHLYGCFPRARGRGDDRLYTTDLEQVTCRRCIAVNTEQQTEQTWHTIQSHKAWLVCCRFVDAPRPRLLDDSEIQDFARLEAVSVVTDAIRRMDPWRATLRNWREIARESEDSNVVDDYRSKIESAASDLDRTIVAGLAERMRPAIEQCTMIGDLLEEVCRLRAAMWSAATEAREGVSRTTLVPGTIGPPSEMRLQLAQPADASIAAVPPKKNRRSRDSV